MIDDETKRGLVKVAYRGQTGGYQATYSFDGESLDECKKHLRAIDGLRRMA